jgi:hypothetical protein
MTRTLTTFAAAAVLAVSAGVASAATTEKTATQSPAYTLNNTMISGYSIKAPAKQTVTSAKSSNGIIMRDGGVCDPIRHMGC